MKLPRKLKVKKTEYDVLLVPELSNGDVAGYCEDEVKLIAISLNQSERERFSTLIHEGLHAIEKEYRLKLKHKTVYALEKALCQLLLDNFTLKPRR